MRLGEHDSPSGDLKKKIRRLSAARGKIVHNGKTEFGQELFELDELVLALLKSEIHATFHPVQQA